MRVRSRRSKSKVWFKRDEYPMFSKVRMQHFMICSSIVSGLTTKIFFIDMQPFQKNGLSSNKAAKTRRNYLVKCCGVRSCYSVDNNSHNSTKIKRNHTTQVGMKNVNINLIMSIYNWIANVFCFIT